MVDITCACRDEDGDITHIGVDKTLIGPDTTTKWSVDEVHQAIKKGTQFFVYHRGINRKIEARTHIDTGKKVLVTLPDQELLNNLDFIKECDSCD